MMHTWSSRIRVALGLALLAAPAVGGSAMEKASELQVRLEPSRKAFKGAQPLLVKFTLANDTGEEVTLLKWHTPLEGVNADIFEVAVDGKPAEYLGRTVKRGPPRPSDYVTIAAHSSVSADVDLSKAYAVYKRGRYQARFRASVHVGPPRLPKTGEARKEPEPPPKLLSSGQVTFDLEEDRPAPAILERREIAPKATTFASCSPEQQAKLGQALQAAQVAAAAARDVLKSSPAVARPAEATRYTTWFGAIDAGRYGVVTTHFAQIADALAGQPIAFNCGCSEDFFAYVYPFKPYEIYLCNQFWSAPATGTDCQFGTLVHETSHFKVVAGTLDTAYGQGGCKGLASSDADAATGTADCHEYFAENDDPRLTMPEADRMDGGSAQAPDGGVAHLPDGGSSPASGVGTPNCNCGLPAASGSLLGALLAAASAWLARRSRPAGGRPHG